jgi:hypothetical protein
MYLPQVSPWWENTCTGSVRRFICSSFDTHHVIITFGQPLWRRHTNYLKYMGQNIYFDWYSKTFCIIIRSCWYKYFSISQIFVFLFCCVCVWGCVWGGWVFGRERKKLFWVISCASKPMSQTFSWHSPPPIKQRISYQHGSKSEHVSRYPLLCINPRNAVINKKHATVSNA